MKILINSAAEREFKEAIDYYNKELPGLGFEFALESPPSVILKLRSILRLLLTEITNLLIMDFLVEE